MGQLTVPLAMGWGWCYGAAHGSPGYGVEMVLWGRMGLWGRDGAMGQLMVSLLMGLRWGYGAACGYGAGMGLWGGVGAMGQPVVPLAMGRGYGAVGSERSTLQPIPDPPLGVRGQQLAIN